MLAVYSEVSAHQDSGTVEVEVSTRREGLDRWRPWLDDLAVATTPGIHVVARNAADLAGLEAIRAAAGKHGGSVEDVDPAAVPGLRPDAGFEPVGAVLLPDEASLDSGALLEALRAATSRLGNIEVVADDALTVDAAGVHTRSSGLVAAAQVVLATGAHTNEVLARSGLTGLLPPLLGGRGVSVLVRATDPTPGCVRTPNRAFACGLHAVPRADGMTYLGATNRLTTTPEPALGPQLSELDDLIGGCVRELDRRLRRAEVVSMSVGHRPVTADRLPLVGRTAEPWLLVATGTWRNGVVLAPLVADLVADEVAEPGAGAGASVLGDPRPDPGTAGRGDDRPRRARPGRSVLGHGSVAPGRASDLEAFFAHALTREIEGSNRTVARLLQRAPMEEALPLLFDLLARRTP